MPKSPPSGNGESQDGIAQASEGPVAGPDGANDGASASSTAPGARAPGAPGHNVTERKKKFLVAPRRPYGGLTTSSFGSMAASTLSLSSLQQALQAAPDIDVVDTVGARSGLATASLGGASEGVLVVRMTDNKASELQQRGQGQLLVERDYHLQLLDPALSRPDLVSALSPYTGAAVELTFLVLGSNGAPLQDAEVSLFGGMLPATGVTGADGQAKLRLFGGDARTITGLYVKPRLDHWSFYQRDPDLITSDANVIKLHGLAEMPSLPRFPQQNAMGWGARAMRLDQLPPQCRGQGVKIAVIDSGAATTHGNLKQIKLGFDIINKKTDPSTWSNDELGHGSHCAGVIGGADPTYGIRGFAPEAEIHVCKLFPGGQVSQLIDALEYCIEHEIDVVNLSLGGGAPSEALEQQILRAKQAGVACIAAAGNSGGPVQYPAASPNVLAVAAIGKLGEFPVDSYHAETVGTDVDTQGYFTAKFSCFGPQVDVCAPGVAVVSSVPPNNFAAWDGTSMATPHITGLAALILAHRADFQGMGRARSPERVERLFQVIRQSARRVSMGDQTRIGNGMPDALAALGLPLMPVQQAGWQPLTGALSGLGGLSGQNGGGFIGVGDLRAPLYGGLIGYPAAAAQMAMHALPFGYPFAAMQGNW